MVAVLDARHRCVVKANAARGRGGYYPLRHHAIALPTTERVVDYFHKMGIRKFYLAELTMIRDGITRRHAAAVMSLARRLRHCEFWLDGGFRVWQDARYFLPQRNIHIIAASETLRAMRHYDVLRRMFGTRLIVSLDYEAHGRLRGLDALRLASSVWWKQRVIVMALRLIGTAHGMASSPLCTLRVHGRSVTLIQGGGVRCAQDVNWLKKHNAKGALIASALYGT